MTDRTEAAREPRSRPPCGLSVRRPKLLRMITERYQRKGKNSSINGGQDQGESRQREEGMRVARSDRRPRRSWAGGGVESTVVRTLQGGSRRDSLPDPQGPESEGWEQNLERVTRKTVSEKVCQISIRARQRNECLEKAQGRRSPGSRGHSGKAWWWQGGWPGLRADSGRRRTFENVCPSVRVCVAGREPESRAQPSDGGAREWQA